MPLVANQRHGSDFELNVVSQSFPAKELIKKLPNCLQALAAIEAYVGLKVNNY